MVSRVSLQRSTGIVCTRPCRTYDQVGTYLHVESPCDNAASSGSLLHKQGPSSCCSRVLAAAAAAVEDEKDTLETAALAELGLPSRFLSPLIWCKLCHENTTRVYKGLTPLSSVNSLPFPVSRNNGLHLWTRLLIIINSTSLGCFKSSFIH